MLEKTFAVLFNIIEQHIIESTKIQDLHNFTLVLLHKFDVWFINFVFREGFA